MNSSSESLKSLWFSLIARLDDEKDASTDLTGEKLRSRGKLLEDESTTERLVFEVERHNPIAGAHYREGFPMSSFETRVVKYACDPETWSISEIECRVVARKIDTLSEVREWEIDFRVSVTLNETTGDYEVTDSNNSFRFTARTLEEAECLITDAVTGFYWGMDLQLAIGEGTEFQDALKKMRIEAAEIAVGALREAWAHPETAEE